MSGVQWFARNGDEITVEQWSALHGDEGYIRVAEDHNADLTVRVSTVWIGLPQYPFTDPPLIFETMIFADDPELDTRMWRYPTEAAALAGHDQVCAAYLSHTAP